MEDKRDFVAVLKYKLIANHNFNLTANDVQEAVLKYKLIANHNSKGEG